jgi:acetyl-CoA acetyltransferase
VNAWVWGVGTSNFGKQPEASTASLAWTAVIEALGDAGVDTVDAVYVGTCFGEPGIAQRVLAGLGIVGVPVLTFENACASSTSAFHEAVGAVDAGRHGSALVLGVEHLTSRFSGAIPVEGRDPEGRAGLALPALYAMSASRYADTFGVTDEQLARISVKNHAHGAHNPRAAYGGVVTLDEVLASRMIADPLTLLQCCGLADAAAAAVVGGRSRSRRDVGVRSSALRSGDLWDQDSAHVWGFDLARRTAEIAYAGAGVEAADIDVFEVHDAFTIGELVTTEALGLAAEGGGGALAASGHTTVGGSQPVNPSGGLLSRGHPLGATGAAQVAEIVWQLRGDAEARQVSGARLGVVETLGGGVGGIDGNACVVAVLESGSAA